ncbi:hypothetical protein, partial [Streptomyces rubiginosohelvolus]
GEQGQRAGGGGQVDDDEAGAGGVAVGEGGQFAQGAEPVACRSAPGRLAAADGADPVDPHLSGVGRFGVL